MTEFFDLAAYGLLGGIIVVFFILALNGSGRGSAADPGA